jgi:hypothetical protein
VPFAIYLAIYNMTRDHNRIVLGEIRTSMPLYRRESVQDARHVYTESRRSIEGLTANVSQEPKWISRILLLNY